MHKLLKADLALITLTILGLFYLYITQQILLAYAILILSIYILSKIIGYKILPYKDFDIFLNHLIHNSKLPFLSGFEIFKTALVAFLFIGFIFIDPSIWIIESMLVIMMRIWGFTFIAREIA